MFALHARRTNGEYFVVTLFIVEHGSIATVHCVVQDSEGVIHTVVVSAASLDEAAVLGLKGLEDTVGLIIQWQI